MSTQNKTAIPNSLNEHWMPFTSNKDFKENPRLIVEAKGVYLKNHQGQTQIDASSGLFCNPLGHGREEIIEAITNQLKTLDYCQPFQQGFGGSFELATRISKHTPGNLNRMFYTICGSTAVETAIKIAIAYHRARGDSQRFRFVGRERGYHGMNIGATSVGGMVNNVKTFASVLMPGVVHMRHTHLPEHKFVSGQPETGVELAEDLERICMNFGAENIAACIVEPIAGSTGTLVPPKGYLQRLREICDKHGILLIFDEVITGFGRLGEWFGSNVVNTVPDILSFAKGITSGYFPLGGSISSNDISKVFNGEPSNAWSHMYTYSAHPGGAAAAMKNLEILENENLIQNARERGIQLSERLSEIKEKSGIIGDNRGIGLLQGLEIVKDKKTKERFEPSKYINMMLTEKLKNRGVWIRVPAYILPVAPPLTSSEDQINHICDAIEESVLELEKEIS